MTFLIETINYFINSFDSHEQLTIGVQSIVIILVIMVAVGSLVQSQLSAASVSNATISDERYVGQKTEMSNPASPTVTPHGKVPHQIVFALP